ncbi:metal-dependent hydrolase [Archaeoglobus neptunius]|uniref:metal-dependent hydrolase n=1 Tax=Archaeoglobus neptunius TaxID=2798580 RepID=UPI001E592FC6|nr:metal-dependent hydrolase [Archaeoglobus neptunius]
MNRPGHIGATLLLLSPFIPRIGTEFVVLAAAFSLLPDIDILLRVKHREYTHNITFGVIMTLTAFFAFKHTKIPPLLSLAIFTAVIIHILVDALTMQKFPPFYPFSKKRVAFRVFRSDNPAVNGASFVLGSLAFVYFAGGGYGWW